jgi:3-hydroxyisobutyrate dehydrogenase
MATIGFIGLGNMGRPMALNLLKNKHDVLVFDVVPEAVALLADAGAKGQETIADLAKNADIIITMLPTGADVKAICMEKYGIFQHAKPGTLIIDSSSIEIDISRELEAIAKNKGFNMIDAPVSGGMTGARDGTLTFMVGGTQEDFARAKPILESMGKTIIYAGPSGNGQAAKICNNLILGVSMIAVSEAFNLAAKLGLDAQTFFDISSHSSGECWAMTHYCPAPGPVPESPANHGYAPGFTAAMMLKDLKLALAAGQSTQTVTPLCLQASALYELLNSRGYAQMDFSGIIKMFAGTLGT